MAKDKMPGDSDGDSKIATKKIRNSSSSSESGSFDTRTSSAHPAGGTYSGGESFVVFADLVPVAISESEIMHAFQQYGNVTEFKRAKDFKNATFVGYFVTYDTESAANKAITAFHGHFKLGKKVYPISVSPCKEKPSDELGTYSSKDSTTSMDRERKANSDVIRKVARSTAVALHDFMMEVAKCDKEELETMPKELKARLELIKDGSLTIEHTTKLIMDNIECDTIERE